jgi:hypothetical protein
MKNTSPTTAPAIHDLPCCCVVGLGAVGGTATLVVEAIDVDVSIDTAIDVIVESVGTRAGVGVADVRRLDDVVVAGSSR